MDIHSVWQKLCHSSHVFERNFVIFHGVWQKLSHSSQCFDISFIYSPQHLIGLPHSSMLDKKICHNQECVTGYFVILHVVWQLCHSSLCLKELSQSTVFDRKFVTVHCLTEALSQFSVWRKLCHNPQCLTETHNVWRKLYHNPQRLT